MSDEHAATASIRFDALTRDELAAAAPTTTLVIPVGSTEQHGHHLPTSVDAAIVEALTLRAAELAAEQVPVLVAPTLPYGCSHHHLPFGGTMSLTTTTYVEVVCDLVSGLADQGFRSVVLMNGHGGNDAALRVAVDRLTNEIRCGAHVAATSYFQVASTGGSPGHAGNFETSLMLALAPELVQLDRRPNDAEPVTPLGRTDVARRQDRAARPLGDERRTHRRRPRRVRRDRRAAARRDLGCGGRLPRRVPPSSDSHQPARSPGGQPLRLSGTRRARRPW